MRNVTVRQLQMFVAAADSHSFARAAEALHVSPAAVSFQIKQIEDMSGFAMFERTGRHVALTDAGRALLGYARQVLQSLQDADQALMALRGVIGGRVTLGAVSTAKYIVPHVMARFQDQYPGVVINLRFGNRQQITEALEAGEIDLAVMGQPPEGADVLATSFAAHPSVIIAAPTHPLVNAPGLRIADIAAERLITREDGSGTRLLMEQACLTAGITPRVGMTTDSNETIKQAVMAGMGIAVISRHTIGLELALGLMRTLPVEGFPVVRSWFVVRRRSMPMMPAHVHLQEFLEQNGQSVIDALEAGYRRAGGQKTESAPRIDEPLPAAPVLSAPAPSALAGKRGAQHR
jgi:DNA-binding transcriptional LysR family regulator